LRVDILVGNWKIEMRRLMDKRDEASTEPVLSSSAEAAVPLPTESGPIDSAKVTIAGSSDTAVPHLDQPDVLISTDREDKRLTGIPTAESSDNCGEPSTDPHFGTVHGSYGWTVDHFVEYYPPLKFEDLEDLNNTTGLADMLHRWDPDRVSFPSPEPRIYVD
jgi:hypothetical protein